MAILRSIKSHRCFKAYLPPVCSVLACWSEDLPSSYPWISQELPPGGELHSQSVHRRSSLVYDCQASVWHVVTNIAEPVWARIQCSLPCFSTHMPIMFFNGVWSIWGADFKSDACQLVNVEQFFYGTKSKMADRYMVFIKSVKTATK